MAEMPSDKQKAAMKTRKVTMAKAGRNNSNNTCKSSNNSTECKETKATRL